MRTDEIKKYKISNKQVMFIIIQTCVGTGILSLPREISEVSKQDGWFSILLGALFWVLAIAIIYKLNSRFPNKNIIEYSSDIFGSLLGKIIALSYIIYSVIMTGIIARLFVIILASYVLPKTPSIVTIFIFFGTCFYLTRQGLKTLARLDEFLFFTLTPVFIVMLPALSKIDLTNFQPVLGTGVTSIFKGSFITIFSYIGPEILLLIFPFIKEKEKTFKYSMAGLGIVCLTYLYLTFLVIGYFGVETLQYIIWPTIDLLKSVKVPFFGRLEFFFIFLWIAIAFTTVSSYFYMASYGLTQLVNWEDQTRGALLIVPAIFYVSFLPNNILEIFDYTKLVSQMGVILSFIIPIIMLTVAKLRGIKGERSND